MDRRGEEEPGWLSTMSQAASRSSRRQVTVSGCSRAEWLPTVITLSCWLQEVIGLAAHHCG